MAQVNCADWNTQSYFEAATAQDIERCLEAGEDPNEWDRNGLNPLYWAVRYATARSVSVLLENGAEAIVVYSDLAATRGWTPLHLAAKFAPTDTAMLLIDIGRVPVDIRIGTGLGATALHIAVKRGAAELVRALIDRGADINLRDQIGRSRIRLSGPNPASYCGSRRFTRNRYNAHPGRCQYRRARGHRARWHDGSWWSTRDSYRSSTWVSGDCQRANPGSSKRECTDPERRNSPTLRDVPI